MKENQTSTTEEAVASKLSFFRGWLVGVRDYPRYFREHFGTNRAARRKTIAQHGSRPHNAKVRPSWMGFWEGRKSGGGLRVEGCGWSLKHAKGAAA